LDTTVTQTRPEFGSGPAQPNDQYDPGREAELALELELARLAATGEMAAISGPPLPAQPLRPARREPAEPGPAPAGLDPFTSTGHLPFTRPRDAGARSEIPETPSGPGSFPADHVEPWLDEGHNSWRSVSGPRPIPVPAPQSAPQVVPQSATWAPAPQAAPAPPAGPPPGWAPAPAWTGRREGATGPGLPGTIAAPPAARPAPAARPQPQAQQVTPSRVARVGAAEAGEEEDDGPPPRHLVKGGPIRRASWREDLVTAVLGGVPVLGLILDGWARLRAPAGGGPFTFPRLMLYGGFLACAAWMLSRHQVRRAWKIDAIPPGYRSGLFGIVVALIGFAGQGLAGGLFTGQSAIVRLVNPFQILLLLGTAMLVSSGFRGAWGGPSPARGLSLREFSPIMLSLIWVTTLVGFFFQYASPYVNWGRPRFDQVAAGSPQWDLVAVAAIFTVLVTNLLFLAPVILTLRRWQPPFGALTMVFGVTGLLESMLTGLSLAGAVAAPLAAGLVADIAITRWPPEPDRPGRLRGLAMVTAFAFWVAYFAVLAVGFGTTWSPALWAGTTVFAGLSAWILAVLMQPSEVPASAWNEPAQGQGGRG
jgi:hypothetical protein